MNDFYVEITETAYYRKIEDAPVDFTPSEVSVLDEYHPLSSTPNKYCSFDSKIKFKSVSERGKVYIRKYSDEWYYVRLESYLGNYCYYYKCDQFDGLLKLLDDRIVVSKLTEMKHIKSFKESIEEDVRPFDPEDYLDYLESGGVDSKSISTVIKEDNLIYLEIDTFGNEADKFERYVRTNIRFKDVIPMTHWDQTEDILYMLIVDRFFYSRNQKWLYKHIKWGKHQVAVELERSFGSNPTVADMMSEFIKAEQAVGLPDGYTMIRNLGNSFVEFWPQEDSDEPIRISDEQIVYLQYLLFKYLGK